MRLVRLFAIACAVFALVLACAAADPLTPRTWGDEGDDVASSLDLSDTLPAAVFVPPVVPPVRGSVFVDHRPPPSCLLTAEVFRPPRARV